MVKFFEKRDWISATASYAAQEQELASLIDRLLDRLPHPAFAKPERVSIIGIGASHAAAAGAVFEMRRNGLDAHRFLPSELPAGLSGLKCRRA